jgi:FKBP-type peptidyl-prolyl cis-trans isomerase SlyD
MLISTNSVVTFNFTVKTDSGDVLDSSESRNEPLHILMGADNVVDGLEEALLGHQVGDRFECAVSADKAYGNYDEDLVQTADIKMFGGTLPSIGQRFTAQTEDGESVSVRVTHIENNVVSIDGNHELAGLDLHFDIEILAVRDATPTELEIGQAIEDE